MRASLGAALLLGTIALCGGVLVSTGCNKLEDCNENPDYCSLSKSEGPSLECIPTLGADPPLDSCGVFVSKDGKSGAKGTKADPVPTLEAAIPIWQQMKASETTEKPSIYLCAEQITEDDGSKGKVPGGVSVYGGLLCNEEWRYTNEKKTVLTAPAGQVPLRLFGAEMTLIKDIDIVAETVPEEMFGVSSIAVSADQANVTFENSTIEARDGAPGMPEGALETMEAENGMPGAYGVEACDINAGLDVKGPTHTCGAEASIGGNGGVGSTSSGAGDGTSGTPEGSKNGGTGQQSDSVVCTGGGSGDPGAQGAPGDMATGLGKLSVDVGYVGTEGQVGKPGAIGQGGGGGGGTMSKPGTTNLCAPSPGASGGSGGTGGCGGAGGLGGGPAGSSIGIVSINSTLAFKTSRVRVGNGGTGGDGGPGQFGGAGGKGGIGGAAMNGVAPGCNGGNGGKGGDGGKGGRGLGGHAIGIAHTGPIGASVPAFEFMGDKGEGGVKKDIQPFEP